MQQLTVQGLLQEVEQLRSRVAQLETGSAQVQTLLHSSPLPIVTFNPEGLITSWNPAAERLFGWTVAEVLGKPLPFIPPEKRQEHEAMRKRDLSGQYFTGREITRSRKDGAVLELSVSTAPLRNAKGELEGILSLYSDITEQKRWQRALQESEQRQRLAIEAGRVALFDWNMLTDRVIWSDRASQLLGLPDGFFGDTGRSFFARVHPDDAERVEDAIRNADAGGHFDVEYRVAPEGVTRWLHGLCQVSFASDGRPLRVCGAVLNTTERRLAEEALKRSNRELEEFAYVAGHDLQEPLRMVAVYTQMLLRKLKDGDEDAISRCQREIQGGVERMRVLIRDLLSYSRVIHVEEDTTCRSECSLDAALDQAMESLRLRIAETGAVIVREPLGSAMADATQIAQVFQNLIANSIKYSTPGSPPHICIRILKSGDECTVLLQDNGIGFDQKYAQRIFGLFKRLHRGTESGTGLGLAICKRIVERYGGRIWAESREGQGATFCFTLPAKES